MSDYPILERIRPGDEWSKVGFAYGIENAIRAALARYEALGGARTVRVEDGSFVVLQLEAA